MTRQLGRVIVGAAAAALGMFVAGFIFFATPLFGIAHGGLGNAEAAEVQRALAANLPRTGTYLVPGTGTSQQTVMYGQGPIATIHYNTDGFPTADPQAMIGGLVLNFIVALLIGLGLLAISARVVDFAARARVAIFLAVAAAVYIHLGGPVWMHHGWTFAVYSLIADAAALSAAGLIIARWFLPVSRPGPDEAPTDV